MPSTNNLRRCGKPLLKQPPPLPPPQVILDSKTSKAELELFPRYLLFLRQQPATRTPQSNIWVNMGMTTMRMFPPYVILPRGNVSLQQDQNKPSTECLTELPPHPNPPLILLQSTDPALAVNGKFNNEKLLSLHKLCYPFISFVGNCSGACPLKDKNTEGEFGADLIVSPLAVSFDFIIILQRYRSTLCGWWNRSGCSCGPNECTHSLYTTSGAPFFKSPGPVCLVSININIYIDPLTQAETTGTLQCLLSICVLCAGYK